MTSGDRPLVGRRNAIVDLFNKCESTQWAEGVLFLKLCEIGDVCECVCVCKKGGKLQKESPVRNLAGNRPVKVDGGRDV